MGEVGHGEKQRTNAEQSSHQQIAKSGVCPAFSHGVFQTEQQSYGDTPQQGRQPEAIPQTDAAPCQRNCNGAQQRIPAGKMPSHILGKPLDHCPVPLRRKQQDRRIEQLLAIAFRQLYAITKRQSDRHVRIAGQLQIQGKQMCQHAEPRRQKGVAREICLRCRKEKHSHPVGEQQLLGESGHNTGRKGKTLWTDNGEGDKVQVYTAENEQDEASHIADVIGQHLKAGGHLADHAILYRMNAQSAPIESYFTRAGIPHKIVGGQRFNDRKEVKDIHSYMSIVANPRDDVRLRRIINEPARKIGATTVEVIADLAGQEGVSMLDIISHADQYAKLSRAVMPLLKFWQIYQRLQDSLETRTLDEFAADVIELTGYKAMLEADATKGHEDAADRLQNLGQLVNNVKNYCDQHGEEATLEGYLEDIALISDIDSYNESADQVVLMTIHSAKGLEFPYVFLIGMEEGVFPSEMSKYSEADLEEERRLAYVGITRAKKELYISNSVSRMLYGRTQRNEPSRFLREIEPEYIEETRSPVLEQRSRFGGWGDSYSDTVPGGASGYSGPSGWGRSAGGYGNGYSAGSRSGYLNREYNAGESRGFGSAYANRGGSTGGYGRSGGSTGYGAGYGSGNYSGAAQKKAEKHISFTGAPAQKPASAGPKHYEPTTQSWRLR